MRIGLACFEFSSIVILPIVTAFEYNPIQLHYYTRPVTKVLLLQFMVPAFLQYDLKIFYSNIIFYVIWFSCILIMRFVDTRAFLCNLH